MYNYYDKPRGKNVDPQRGKSQSGLKLDLQTECEALEQSTTTSPVFLKVIFMPDWIYILKTTAYWGFGRFLKMQFYIW